MISSDNGTPFFIRIFGYRTPVLIHIENKKSGDDAKGVVDLHGFASFQVISDGF